MTRKTPPAVSFIAPSGTGKTTLVTKLIAELKKRGYKVGAIKHDAHKFDIDHPGKDSFRFTESGADSMLICSRNKLAFVKQNHAAPEIDELISTYFADVDIVLVEGFKDKGLPKIVVFREGYSPALLTSQLEQDQNLLAITTDCALKTDIPVFDLNRPESLVDFLLNRFGI